ncbi:MAG TPA: hypothetical protein VH142_22065 [Polyangiaceae bacterium]|nr:hypothetical protein [Polyangiaceae bacterium]
MTSSGCAGSAIPDPRAAVAAYATAAERGDARGVYAMLTDEAKRAYGPDGTRRLLDDARLEIVREAKNAGSAKSVVHAVAEVRYVDGERADLDVENGHFRVSAAAGLPAGARTVAEALGELRGALAERSYAALVRILSTDTRGAIEVDMRSLVSGLEHPDALEVKVHGETAEVDVPGGHKVLLRREAGVWRVHDFD